jgi:UPF0716 protein FxsA
MFRLLLLFIALPALELALLIEIGSRIGTAPTIGLIVVTGIVGASMARQQGLRVIGTVQQELGEGRLPAASLLDGLMILVASALLVTPGILTDVFGFLCLVPAFRAVARRAMLSRFERAVREQKVHVHFGEAGFPGASEGDGRADRAIDVTPRPPGPGPSDEEGDETTRRDR